MVEKAVKSRSPYAERLAHAMSLPENQLSPVQLAEVLGVTRQAIEKLFRGDSVEMSASNNAKAAQRLQVDPTWLAIGEGVPRPEEFHVRWQERKLLELYRALPADEQDEFAVSLEARYSIHANHANAPHPFPDAKLPPKRMPARGRQ